MKDEITRLHEIDSVVRPLDHGAQIFVAARDFLSVNKLYDATIAIVTEPNRIDILSALAQYCISESESADFPMQLTKTEASLNDERLSDVIYINVRISI